MIFSCGTGAKVVSVCAYGDLSAGVVWLGYRYGLLGKPEMIYPPSGPWRGLVRAGMGTFSGGGGAYLTFRRDSFRYVVYTAIGRGWGEKAGVAVERNGKLLTNQTCRGKPVSELGPDFFADSGIPDDPAPFDPPTRNRKE